MGFTGGVGSPGRTRTTDQRINSPSLYQLSYRGTRACKAGRHSERSLGVCQGNETRNTLILSKLERTPTSPRGSRREESVHAPQRFLEQLERGRERDPHVTRRAECRARHERDTLGLEQLLADLDVVREA